MTIEIRPPKNSAEIRQMETVQAQTWIMDERGITPYNALHGWFHSGGILLGAFDGTQMVGFAASIMAELGGKRAQWSQLAAVIPAYRRQGIARQLKLAQREAALQRGIDLIGWTFDPLRRENAVFNIGALGAKVIHLHHEFYGEMQDSLNKGLLSDRFEVYWQLKDRTVQKLAKQEKVKDFLSFGTYVTEIENQKPQLKIPELWAENIYTVCLPSNLETLRQNSIELVREWNFALREAFAQLTTAGYQLTGVYAPPNSDIFGYTFQKPEPWFLYILETSDGSFYTGITNDLEKRIKTHNTGKGASYTAARRPVKLIASWEAGERVNAMRLERHLKKLTRAQKEKLIASQGDFENAKRLS